MSNANTNANCSRTGGVLKSITGGHLKPNVPIESFVSGGLVTQDYYFALPLKHLDPSCSTKITVFARRVVSIERQADAETLPWLIFFQGGPGFQGPAYNSGWVKVAAKKYNVLLLDQRGTGLSTPITVQTLSHLKTPQEQADYFMQFRADSIVRDSEMIRETLLAGCAEKKWSLLGQSYGGFCITTYLSFFPDSVTAAYMTGGIPPMMDTLEKAYTASYKRVMDYSETYYRAFPMDVSRVREIMAYLATHKVELPAGGILTPRKFQMLGLNLGVAGGNDRLHSLCLQAFITVEGGQRVLSQQFLIEMGAQDLIPPIYAVLHESIYCDGPGMASNWTASKLLRERYADVFNYSVEGYEADAGKIVYFTGEHMYDWMFDDYVFLRPLKECADILAKHDNWSKLYDVETLRKNTVPVSACVYYNDMYVDRDCSENTAKQIQGIRLWVTNEYLHSGLRDAGEVVLTKLMKMASGEVDVPIV